MLSLVGVLESDGAIWPWLLMLLFLCWTLASWLSLVLADLVFLGGSSHLRLQVKVVVPNGIRPLVFLDGINPPGKQAELAVLAVLIVPGGSTLSGRQAELWSMGVVQIHDVR